MSRAISRDSFDPLKNYLGVHMQQGRVVLDSDWNENQDIAVAHMRRLARETIGGGSSDHAFTIEPVVPPPVDTAASEDRASLETKFPPLFFQLDFDGFRFEDFESRGGFSPSPDGHLRIGHGRPYQGSGFLRLSGHSGITTISKTIPVQDLSAFEIATFQFRVNHPAAGPLRFFLEDTDKNRTVWRNTNTAFAGNVWLPGFALPLNPRFRILTSTLPEAVAGQNYFCQLWAFGGQGALHWDAVIENRLPPNVEIGEELPRVGKLEGLATTGGAFAFDVRVRDEAGAQDVRPFTLQVKGSGQPPKPKNQAIFPETLHEFTNLVETPTGRPADLTRIQRFGFQVFQDANQPLVWEFDALRLGSAQLYDSAADNNFVIRGSRFQQLLSQLAVQNALAESTELFKETVVRLQNVDSSAAMARDAGHFFTGGLTSLIVQDVLYSEQADPNDPPLTKPAAGLTRRDTVYLDVWTEPVTYVEDPAIREIALGGLDTTTRTVVRQRVRVAEDGDLPTGNGMGQGTLSTDGIYTALENRLYRVEIDTAGDLGSATFRWSDDNASTLQRIIEPVPRGSTQVVVEDGSAFRPDDRVLIRKEFGAEEHTVAEVKGNVIGLQTPTGAHLATLPAANDPLFLTFSLADRPRIERWSGFRVPILPDPQDDAFSAAIELNDGVEVSFGGHGFVAGDYWNFTARTLAASDTVGIVTASRLERLDCERPRGVEHHFEKLALLTRHGDAEASGQILRIEDRRRAAGATGHISSVQLNKAVELQGTKVFHLGAMRLRNHLQHVLLLFGDLIHTGVGNDAEALLTAVLYDDTMTDPVAEPGRGRILEQGRVVNLAQVPANVLHPLRFMFLLQQDSEDGLLRPESMATSVQLFASLSDTDGAKVFLSKVAVTVLESR